MNSVDESRLQGLILLQDLILRPNSFSNGRIWLLQDDTEIKEGSQCTLSLSMENGPPS